MDRHRDSLFTHEELRSRVSLKGRVSVALIRTRGLHVTSSPKRRWTKTKILSLASFVRHHQLYISALLSVSLKIGYKPPITIRDIYSWDCIMLQ